MSVVGLHWMVMTPLGADVGRFRNSPGGSGFVTSTWTVPTLTGDGGSARPLTVVKVRTKK